MSPFEIIISLLVYLFIGIYLSQNSATALSARQQFLVVTIWPLLLIIGGIAGDKK